MDRQKIEKFKKILLEYKSKIITSGVLTSREDLAIQPEDLADEADLATNVINQQVTFNIRQRELNKLQLIENALHKIDNGTYGICEECDEEIAEKRLENQPWTTLCITHAEEQEREAQRFLKAG